MQVFKCAMRIIRANLGVPLVFIVILSFMGVFIALSIDSDNGSNDFERCAVNFAVVDRDDSELSQGIVNFLEQDNTRVFVEDTPIALQDLVAKGKVALLLIIPNGYGEHFVQAALAGEDVPIIDVANGYSSMEGALANQSVSEYLGLVRSLLAANAASSNINQPSIAKSSEAINLTDTLQKAADLAQQEAKVNVLESQSQTSVSTRFVTYLQFCVMTVFMGLFSCVGLLLIRLNQPDTRKRNLVSPVKFISLNLQSVLACGVVALFAWVWTFGLGLVVFPQVINEVGLLGVTFCALALLVFCLVPLGAASLFVRFSTSALACTAVAIICGQALGFFSGGWIPLDLMEDSVRTVAHWLPGFWYAEVCSLSMHLGSTPSFTTFVPVLQTLGVLFLFGAALLALSLVVGKARQRQSS